MDAVFCDVENLVLAEAERGVVVGGTSMLDEKQGGTDGMMSDV